jgi:hypothetical protein
VNHVDRWEHGGTTDIGKMALVCTHNHDDLERGAKIVMINGRAHWIEPAWLDPSQTPRLNTAHHLPRIFTEHTTPSAEQPSAEQEQEPGSGP